MSKRRDAIVGLSLVAFFLVGCLGEVHLHLYEVHKHYPAEVEDDKSPETWVEITNEVPE